MPIVPLNYSSHFFMTRHFVPLHIQSFTKSQKLIRFSHDRMIEHLLPNLRPIGNSFSRNDARSSYSLISAHLDILLSGVIASSQRHSRRHYASDERYGVYISLLRR
jgi:hypothetical protein